MSDERDIVERGRAMLRRFDRIKATGIPFSDVADGLSSISEMLDEIERLRTALRSVRASTDPRWQAQIISDALREKT
jgi:hypothetical protein